MKSNEEVRKLSKLTKFIISFFFGAGVISVGGGLAIVAFPAYDWILVNSETVINVMLSLVILPVIWLFGRPAANLLENR